MPHLREVLPNYFTNWRSSRVFYHELCIVVWNVLGASEPCVGAETKKCFEEIDVWCQG